MSLPRVTYIRFVIGERDEFSHVSQGIFQAAFKLRDSGILAEHEFFQIEDDLSWLKMHLKSPTILNEPKTERAIYWFHPRAEKPIDRIRSIARLLDEYGYRVRMITSDRPGTVVYEDGWQIVAYPFRDPRGKL